MASPCDSLASWNRLSPKATFSAVAAAGAMTGEIGSSLASGGAVTAMIASKVRTASESFNQCRDGLLPGGPRPWRFQPEFIAMHQQTAKIRHFNEEGWRRIIGSD